MADVYARTGVATKGQGRAFNRMTFNRQVAGRQVVRGPILSYGTVVLAKSSYIRGLQVKHFSHSFVLGTPKTIGTLRQLLLGNGYLYAVAPKQIEAKTFFLNITIQDTRVLKERTLHTKYNLISHSFTNIKAMMEFYAEYFHLGISITEPTPTKLTHTGTQVITNSVLVATATKCKHTNTFPITQSFILQKTQETFTDAINGDIRNITPKVFIYFDGDSADPTEFTLAEVSGINLLEELKADSSNILGNLSSNEVRISLKNENRELSPTNRNGRFYGKLVPGVRIVIGLELKSRTGIIYDIHLGVFYSTDWSDIGMSSVLTVKANDRFYNEGRKAFAGTRLFLNVTCYTLFDLIFKSCEIPAGAYEISNELQKDLYRLPMAWIPRGNLRSALSFLAAACNAFVYVGRDDKYHVEPFNTLQSRSGEIADHNQLINLKIPTSYFGAYSRLKIDVNNLYLGEEKEVLSVSELSFPGTEMSFSTPEYRLDKVGKIKNIELKAVNTKIVSFDNTTETITMRLKRDAVNDKLTDIKVFGQPIMSTTTSVEKKSAEIEKHIGEKTYEVTHPLIQNKELGLGMLNKLFPILFNPHSNVQANIRGNPRLRIGTIVDIKADSRQIESQQMLIYRSKLDWAGGLSSELTGYIVGGGD